MGGVVGALALAGRRLRRREPSQRTAAAGAAAGQRHDHPEGGHGAAGRGSASARNRTQQIPQNQNHPQPPIKGDKAPLTVVVVIANQTRTDSKLELRGPRDVSSVPIAGRQHRHAADRPADRHLRGRRRRHPRRPPGKLVVGPYRASSQNDVLLP